MSKRLNPCQTCTPEDSSKFMRRGWTRHANRICAKCRRHGPPSETPNLSGRAA